MQSKACCKVMVDTKSLANLMDMEEVEVRFFPKKAELKSMLNDYNYGVLSKEKLIQKLSALKEQCFEEKLDVYANGVSALIKVIECRYC